jgi:hypothetical protein
MLPYDFLLLGDAGNEEQVLFKAPFLQGGVDDVFVSASKIWSVGQRF